MAGHSRVFRNEISNLRKPVIMKKRKKYEGITRQDFKSEEIQIQDEDFMTADNITF